MSNHSIGAHFEGKEPQVKQIYEALLNNLSALGEVKAVPKQTSIHLDNNTGFAGVYTRRDYINLHFRLAEKVEHPRIAKVEQLSANRFKHTIQLNAESDVDEQLLEWLKKAYELAG